MNTESRKAEPRLERSSRKETNRHSVRSSMSAGALQRVPGPEYPFKGSNRTAQRFRSRPHEPDEAPDCARDPPIRPILRIAGRSLRRIQQCTLNRDRRTRDTRARAGGARGSTYLTQVIMNYNLLGLVTLLLCAEASAQRASVKGLLDLVDCRNDTACIKPLAQAMGFCASESGRGYRWVRCLTNDSLLVDVDDLSVRLWTADTVLQRELIQEIDALNWHPKLMVDGMSIYGDEHRNRTVGACPPDHGGGYLFFARWGF